MFAPPLRIAVHAHHCLEPLLHRDTGVANVWCRNVECHNGLEGAGNKMQATHSKAAGDTVPPSERSLTHNEGDNDDDADEWDEWDEVFANGWQRNQYEGFCWRQQKRRKQPMSYAAWSQLRTELDAELELKRLWVAEQEKQWAQV